VPAGGRVARVVEEDDAEVGAIVVRLDDEAAVHVRVPARLVHEKASHVVEPFQRVAALVEDRPPAWRLDSAGHDPERLARGVVVDRSDRGLSPLEGRRALLEEGLDALAEVLGLGRRLLELRLE
jgi:hypothetical protein